MNGLLAVMAAANPVITALLTVVVFLEKDKIKKRSEDLEAALKAGNQELVQTVAAQKENFENIASRLEALSKDSAKSAETFVGLSTALTESSAVSATALNGVTTGLEKHAKLVEGLVTNLSNHVSSTTTNAINELSKKSEETLLSVANNVKSLESAQTSAIETLGGNSKNTLDSISKVATGAINDLGKRSEETLLSVANNVKSLESAQTSAIETLSNTSTENLKAIADEVKKVETAQIAVATAIRELQETLKNTVSL